MPLNNPPVIPHSRRVLDWQAAADRSHELKWAAPSPFSLFVVNKRLALPSWHWTHDQGYEGSCVGHGTVMERAISNTAQNRILRILLPGRRYNPIDLWNEAKIRDEWPDTNPGDDNGTSVHAGYDVCLYEGLQRVKSMQLGATGIPTPIDAKTRDIAEGVSEVRWARTVDEVRFAIANGNPVTIGINWYSNFDNPTHKTGFNLSWIGEGDLGSIRGGHCVCIYGAADRYQAVAIKNSWGRSYPLIWMPYATLQRLLNEDGEAALVTDK
jgi:hypothetical protein